MRAEGHSANTIRRRAGTLFRIQRDTGKNARDLDIDDITIWLGQYRSAGTRASYFGDLEAFFRWLKLTEDLPKAPTDRIRRPRQPRRQPRPISTAQLYRALDTATGDVLDWILLGAYQGFRVSDTAAMDGRLIDGGRLRVVSKGGSDKTIPLHQELAGAAAVRPRRGWWFPGARPGTHITAHTVGERVTEHFATHVGICDFTYHRLRHWCGTEMLRNGASLREVQEFLRHEVITSTAMYTQVLLDDLAVAAARLPTRPGHPSRLRVVS